MEALGFGGNAMMLIDFEKARLLFFQYRDKDFSFTDCTSLAVMRQVLGPAGLVPTSPREGGQPTRLRFGGGDDKINDCDS